jgi:hypothetical protein
MCDGFLNKKKKIRVVAPTVHITTLKGNAQTLVNLREKKWWASWRKGPNLIKKQKKNIKKVTVMRFLSFSIKKKIRQKVSNPELERSAWLITGARNASKLAFFFS